MLRHYIDHPDLLECAQTLSINVPQPMWRDRWHGYDTVGLSYSSLLDAQFPRASGLGIGSFNLPHTEECYFKRRFPSLTSLLNSDISLDELLSLIMFFPRLSSLSLHKVPPESHDSGEEGIRQTVPISVLIRLRHLETDMGLGSVGFIKFVENLPVKPPVSHVRILWDGRGPRRELAAQETVFAKDVCAYQRHVKIAVHQGSS
ncbi:unnamed protein product [Somion occarium]|uniref:Uncharacterized protein n=1 Tax=Somion occarium TaxID=3059160 RepID=A0ABP1DIQ3_9APHY